MKELSMRRFKGISACVWVMAIFLSFLGACPVVAQEQVMQLEQRVQALEEYVDGIRPTLIEFSQTMQEGLDGYTRDLETSLDEYANRLRKQINRRLETVEDQTILLNPTSRAFQRIDTNAGFFLILVRKLEAVENGFRLYLSIGNPHSADFKDFKLKMFWGSRWQEGLAISYDEWKQSLMGAEFSFEGTLMQGKWNNVEVDLVPADARQLQHVECTMQVLSIELDML